MRERELCKTCGGNGSLKITGGIKVCPTCDGHCWACPTSETKTVLRLREALEELHAKLVDNEKHSVWESHRWRELAKSVQKVLRLAAGWMVAVHNDYRLPPVGGPFHEVLKRPSNDTVWIVEQNGRVHSVHATHESAMAEKGENLSIGAPWRVLAAAPRPKLATTKEPE